MNLPLQSQASEQQAGQEPTAHGQVSLIVVRENVLWVQLGFDLGLVGLSDWSPLGLHCTASGVSVLLCSRNSGRQTWPEGDCLERKCHSRKSKELQLET